MRHPQQHSTHFARLKVPANQERFVPVPGWGGAGPSHFVPVEQLIIHHAAELFPGLEIVDVYPFRVTRNADIRRDEEEAGDLIAMISEELRQRRNERECTQYRAS